ncbi:uncharacterized protein VTP21DRAFT_4970 [Calcarisporiella thermophila]|uniref:uncharacterized protein n=1 Tax=Calcarisporiella thermophila TaxID=911321 RepID=UPI003744A827
MNRVTRVFARSNFQTAAIRHVRRGGGHHQEWNQPSGRLFGEKPLAPGQKRVKEDWETVYYWGMFGGLTFGAIAYYYKPDTSITTWATKEAEQRLRERGVSLEYPSN